MLTAIIFVLITHRAKARAGQTVLIHGASGSVSTVPQIDFKNKKSRQLARLNTNSKVQ